MADPPAVRRIQEIPARWAGARGDALALEDASGAWTWRELELRRALLAESLAALGVRAGDRVMVVGENSCLAVALIFAITTLDAQVVNVNARLAAREVDLIRDHATPRRVLYLVGASADAGAHAARHGARALALQAWAPLAASALDEGCVADAGTGDPARDVAALLYTTGTTGEPKGVMLTHANVLFIARVSSELRRVSPADRIYGLLPISHVYGLASVCVGSLYAGASLHLQARFDPASTARLLRERQLTVCQGVPAMWAKLLEHLRAEPRPWSAPALRFLYAGGSPLAPALKAQVEAVFGQPLHNGYGLTEASPTLTQTRLDEPRTDCSVGRAIPGVELRIVDAAGHDVASGEPGELWARGPNIMKGYYRDPEASAAVMRPGGWLATGDLARAEPDGAIHIVGRLKELIIRSGFNVFPVEVEAVLNAHPDVVHSAVVGRSTVTDEEVVAFVELAPGARATAESLRDYAAASLAPYKRPAQVIVLDTLPVAANGKVLKGRLAELAREYASPA